MKYRSVLVFSGFFLAACATTSVQPLAKDSFKVVTNAAPACGPQGARNIAFQTAAIEVIRKGGDLFVIAGDSTNYDGWSGVSEQGMVVKMIDRRSAEADNALSARESLGANWQKLVQDGAPTTCT
jgi:hypothetical protein